MPNSTSVELKRDCEAVQIPAGNTVTLIAGTLVDVTQTLGGTYTVRAPAGLYRIARQDADALGLEPGAGKPDQIRDSGPVGSEQVEKMVWETLKTCYDPEIPVNIVDLGLVYDLHVEPATDAGYKVFVKMTLTAPGCGMGTVIAGDAQQKLLFLPSVREAEVEIVWDPAWHQSMISSEGRRILGLE